MSKQIFPVLHISYNNSFFLLPTKPQTSLTQNTRPYQAQFVPWTNLLNSLNNNCKYISYQNHNTLEFAPPIQVLRKLCFIGRSFLNKHWDVDVQ